MPCRHWHYAAKAVSQVTQDIGPIFLPNVGPLLDQYCTNIQPICNQYYLPYLSFSRSPAATDCLLKLLSHAVPKCRYSCTHASVCPWRPTQNINDHRTISDRSRQNDHDRPMFTTWSGSESSNGYGKRSCAIDCRMFGANVCR